MEKFSSFSVTENRHFVRQVLSLLHVGVSNIYIYLYDTNEVFNYHQKY